MLRSHSRAAIGASLLLLAVPLHAQNGTPSPKSTQRITRWTDFDYTIGYRWVRVQGSDDRFDTDFNLDSGFRLAALSLDYHFLETKRFPSEIRVESRGLADPWEKHSITFAKDGLYEASARLERNRYKFRANGDFHRVDRKSRVAGYDLSIPLEAGAVFASFTRTDLDGFWLTNRVGNRNLTPLYTITNVSSPRQLTEDEAELGVSLHAGGTSLTLAGEYLNQDENNRWIYSQPSVGNPAFTESENTRSGASLEGPGGRVNLAHHRGRFDLDLNTRFLDRRRRVVAAGTGTGFDTAQYDSSLQSFSDGSARTYLAEGTLTYELSDRLVLNSDLRYLDHQEQLDIDQTDSFFYPASSTRVNVHTNRRQRTNSRLREATAEMDWQLHDALTLTGGWGWSQEKLRVPDLDPSDADFARGTVIEDGFVAGLHWRPDARWSLRARYRNFGQAGVRLHEMVERHTRGVRANLGYKTDTAWWDAGVVHRRGKNPVADSRTENTAYTLSGGVHTGEDLHWHASYTLSDINSRTRSTFYFAPSTTPASTLVGFRGESQSVTTALDWQVSRSFHASCHGTYTTVHGDYELDMYHWGVDLARQLTRGRIGVRVEQMDYHEAANPDDYTAWTIFVYMSATLRGQRPAGY